MGYKTIIVSDENAITLKSLRRRNPVLGTVESYSEVVVRLIADFERGKND